MHSFPLLVLSVSLPLVLHFAFHSFIFSPFSIFLSPSSSDLALLSVLYFSSRSFTLSSSILLFLAFSLLNIFLFLKFAASCTPSLLYYVSTFYILFLGNVYFSTSHPSLLPFLRPTYLFSVMLLFPFLFNFVLLYLNCSLTSLSLYSFAFCIFSFSNLFILY